MTAVFLINSILLGVGLAMDAFSVSLANGLDEPDMPGRRMCMIAGVFGGFQLLMPLIGWICVHTAVELLTALDRFIPWIALILLVLIGGKMLLEGIRGDQPEDSIEAAGVSIGALLLQGIATSIDALSVGFTIADYNAGTAFVSALIIGAVTFFICMGGLRLGGRFGVLLANKAQILGGVILICIGLEICFL